LDAGACLPNQQMFRALDAHTPSIIQFDSV
jgi:hypothetical protein